MSDSILAFVLIINFGHPVMIIGQVVMLVFFAFLSCRICMKLGHSPSLGLIWLIPGIGALLWSMFCAFAESPNEKAALRTKKQNRKSRRPRGGGTKPGGSSGNAWSSTPEDRAADALDDLFG